MTSCIVHQGAPEVGTVEFMVAGGLDDPEARFVFMEAGRVRETVLVHVGFCQVLHV